MRSLSTFQTLPLHIVQAIADYCIDNSCISRSRIPLAKDSSLTWEAFYDVSNLWRVLAIRYFCKSLHVLLSRESDGKVSFVGLPSSIKVHKQFYNYVRSLTLTIGNLVLEPYSEMAERYSEVWPKDVTLTSASSLIMRTTLNLDNCTAADNHEVNEKIFKFLQRIRASMPKLRDVKFERRKDYRYSSDHSATIAELKLDNQFVVILKRASKVEVLTWPSLLDGRDAQLLNGSLITSLSLDFSKDMHYFAIVLQRVGSTLESLEINNVPLQSINSLVFNSDGSPIVYSQLKRLRFQSNFDLQRTASRIDLIATPFPSLCYLKWISDYPFRDDVLFRGSQDTLEYLHVIIYETTTDILKGYMLNLKSTRYTRLRHLIVNMRLHTWTGECDRLLKFGASCISSETQTFVMGGEHSWQHVLDAFSTSLYTGNIRILSLASTALSLLEMMDLIKLLPSMTDFACSFTGLGTYIHEWMNQTLVDRIYPEYYPLSHRLKCWDAIRGPITEVATAAVTLAVLCPRLTFVAVPYRKTNVYQAKLKEAIERGEYSDHQDKIQHLISD